MKLMLKNVTDRPLRVFINHFGGVPDHVVQPTYDFELEVPELLKRPPVLQWFPGKLVVLYEEVK